MYRCSKWDEYLENIGLGIHIRFQARKDKTKKKSTSTSTKFPVLFLYSNHRPQLQINLFWRKYSMQKYFCRSGGLQVLESSQWFLQSVYEEGQVSLINTSIKPRQMVVGNYPIAHVHFSPNTNLSKSFQASNVVNVE